MNDGESPTGTTSAVTVVCANEQSEVAIDAGRWRDLASRVLQAEQQAGELTLTFVGRDEIAALNVEHMGSTGPTDVLSFPLDAAEHGVVGPGPRLLGDVVVCPAVAADQAPTNAATLDDELALLIVHGILHVLGWDHATEVETATMRAREQDLLAACHLLP